MLNVYGVVAVATKFPIEIVESNSGFFFNFHVVAQRPDNDSVVVVYPAYMWVPPNEKEKWETMIHPRAVFHIEHGYLDIIQFAEGKGQMAKIKLQRQHLRYMTRPVWVGAPNG